MMFMVKCKCGSVFTITEDGVRNTKSRCPNCGVVIPIDVYASMSDDRGLHDVVEYVRVIPDDAKITITFDA